MPIEVIYRCGGCFAEAKGELVRKFKSFNGKGWGWGRYVESSAQEAAPTGWVAFDPWTSCTYCPSCWSEISGGDDRPPADSQPALRGGNSKLVEVR